MFFFVVVDGSRMSSFRDQNPAYTQEAIQKKTKWELNIVGLPKPPLTESRMKLAVDSAREDQFQKWLNARRKALQQMLKLKQEKKQKEQREAHSKALREQRTRRASREHRLEVAIESERQGREDFAGSVLQHTLAPTPTFEMTEIALILAEPKLAPNPPKLRVVEPVNGAAFAPRVFQTPQAGRIFHRHVLEQSAAGSFHRTDYSSPPQASPRASAPHSQSVPMRRPPPPVKSSDRAATSGLLGLPTASGLASAGAKDGAPRSSARDSSPRSARAARDSSPRAARASSPRAALRPAAARDRSPRSGRPPDGTASVPARRPPSALAGASVTQLV